MQRSPRHPFLASSLAFLSLIAVAILPIGGVASAAPAPTVCQPGEGNACVLAISAPESVAVGQPFTVKVTLMQYSGEGSIPLPKSDFCASKTVVSLDVFQGEGTPTTYVAKASAGVATFSVSVPSADFWALHAQVLHPEGGSNCGFFDEDFAGFNAVNIPLGQPIAPCPADVSCLQLTSNPNSPATAATLFADNGSFSASFGSFTQGCGVNGPADLNGVLSFNYSGVDSKTIVLALSSNLVTKGIGLYKICWRSTNEFTQLGGTPAPFDGSFFTGFLPSCKKNDVGPCVLFKMSGQHNVAFCGILAPLGDPQVYPE